MADLPTRAFTVHAPWAWAFFHAGKDVENRSSNFQKRYRGRVWVHASLWPGHMNSGSNIMKLVHERSEMIERLGISDALGIGGESRFMLKKFGSSASCEQLNKMRGHIVGSVEIYGYATPYAPPASRWHVPGSHAVLVRDPVPLARPVPARGALGLWTVKPETREALKGPR